MEVFRYNRKCFWRMCIILCVFDFQICISFLLHRGFVAIPKSVTPKRIIENQRATEITLNEGEIQQLMGINKNQRLFKDMEIIFPKGTTLEEALDTEADEKFVRNEYWTTCM